MLVGISSVCVAVPFAAAVFFMHAQLHLAPQSIATDLGQPLPVATSWHAFGQAIWTTAALAIAASCIGYFAALKVITGSAGGPRIVAAIIPGVVLALAAALALPVIFSSDVYAYGGYGVMDAHGLSPYVHARIAVDDSLFRAAVWQWSNPLPLCVYGPLFVWIAKVTVLWSAGGGVAMQLLALRILSSCALLACAPLAYLAFMPISRQAASLAAAGIVLNPVAIWSAAEGHNDTFLLCIVLLGFTVLRFFGSTAGAFVIASSALIKAPGTAAAFVLAAYAWNGRAKFYKILAGIAGGIALTAIVARPFAEGIRTVLVPHGHYTPQFSAQYFIAQIVQALFSRHAPALELGIAIAIVASGALALHGVRLALRGELQGAAFIALGAWLIVPNPYPWYAIWILPTAFLAVGSRAFIAVIAASIAIFVRYLPDVAYANNVDLNLVITLCEVAIPLYLLLPAQRALDAEAVAESDSAH